ncbi:MAG: hypothetical protein K8R64_05485 [Methanosarcinaceae archaeon]|nr:hypothetical protein [Methanosarcinaceae archaeon]
MIEKLYRIHIAYIFGAGILVTAFLFNSLLKYADEGNLMLVILMGLAIGIVALVITKVVAYQRYFQQFEDE